MPNFTLVPLSYNPPQQLGTSLLPPCQLEDAAGLWRASTLHTFGLDCFEGQDLLLFADQSCRNRVHGLQFPRPRGLVFIVGFLWGGAYPLQSLLRVWTTSPQLTTICIHLEPDYWRCYGGDLVDSALGRGLCQDPGQGWRVGWLEGVYYRRQDIGVTLRWEE